MFRALARRFRQLFQPKLPEGDVADASWSDVGPLPPASLMPPEDAGLIPLDLSSPPPVPLDARRPPTAPVVTTTDDQDWDAVIARARTLVRTPPPVRLGVVIRDPGSEDRTWQEMIARAKRRPELTPPPRATPAPRRHRPQA